MISFLLPTRGRSDLVNRFFSSIVETTSHLKDIEVVLYLDEDDTGSHNLDSADFRVVRIVGPMLSMGGFNSACLEKATGDVIILANDDMVIRTPGWDSRIRALHAKFKDQIYFSYPNDLFREGRIPVFPIISRRVCKLLDDPYPAVYQKYFIEVHLFDIFKRLQHAGFDRIYYYDNVRFEHLHYRAGKATYDETYSLARNKRFDDDMTFVALTAMRSKNANRLISAIRNEPIPAGSDVNYQDAVPTSIVSTINLFFRRFLLNGELPYRWRLFLFIWLSARYFFAKIFL